MKCTINSHILKEALSIVNHATASITTTPILENILMRVQYNSVILTSNNLEMAIEYSIHDGISDLVEGAFCIPSKLFTSYISLVQDAEVVLEVVTGESLSIATESGTIKIKGNPAADFPVIPHIKEETQLSLKGKVLKKAIEKTLFSCAEGNIRPTLAGIYVHIENDTASFASTDSFRLSEYATPLETQNSASFTHIIPSKTTNELKSIVADDEIVKVITGENQIAFVFGNTKFYSRLLNGKFPDYTNFFPHIFSTKAEVNRIDLIQALRKINLISRENNYSIKMSFSGNSELKLETNQTQI